MSKSKERTGLQRAFWSMALLITLGILTTVTAARLGRSSVSGIVVVNNSTSLEIRHLYLSPVDHDDWGPDLLSNSTIASGGGSFTLNDVACAQGNIKVIAEDQNGCFLYKTVSCADNVTWAIGNDATPDCGN